MRIEAKTSADIVGITVKRNQTHDGKEAYLDIEIGVDREDAAKFGDDFEDLAFASMRECDDEEGGGIKIVHLQDSIKPGIRVVYERHALVIDKQKLYEQPELLSIKPVDGAARVVAKYRLPIPPTAATVLAALMGKVGDVVSIDFSPEQQLFELKQKEPRKSAVQA